MAAYRRVDDLTITCRLTACTPGSAPGPTLGVEYGKPLPFYLYSFLCNVRVICVGLHIRTSSSLASFYSATSIATLRTRTTAPRSCCIALRSITTRWRCSTRPDYSASLLASFTIRSTTPPPSFRWQLHHLG